MDLHPDRESWQEWKDTLSILGNLPRIVADAVMKALLKQ